MRPLAQDQETPTPRLRRSRRAWQQEKAAVQQLARQVRRLERDRRQLKALHELASWLLACSTPEEACNCLGGTLPRLFSSDSVSLSLFNDSGDMLEVCVHARTAPGRPLFSPDECCAVRLGRAHVCSQRDTPAPGPNCRHWGEGLPGSSVCVPLHAPNQCLGVLHVAQAHPGPLRKATRLLAVAAAQQIALALHGLRLRQVLSRQALRDPLTDLYNRRSMEDYLRRELARQRRQAGGALGVLMIDVDHFRDFNTRHGHVLADVFLCRFAKLLQSFIRAGEDVACRYGREEFVLILPGASGPNTLARGEELRRTCESFQVAHGDQLLGPVTLSVGVASYPEHEGDEQMLLLTADRALYRAKSAGRNRVVLADAPALRRAGEPGASL